MHNTLRKKKQELRNTEEGARIWEWKTTLPLLSPKAVWLCPFPSPHNRCTCRYGFQWDWLDINQSGKWWQGKQKRTKKIQNKPSKCCSNGKNDSVYNYRVKLRVLLSDGDQSTNSSADVLLHVTCIWVCRLQNVLYHTSPSPWSSQRKLITKFVNWQLPSATADLFSRVSTTRVLRINPPRRVITGISGRERPSARSACPYVLDTIDFMGLNCAYFNLTLAGDHTFCFYPKLPLTFSVFLEIPVGRQLSFSLRMGTAVKCPQ